MVKGFPTSQYLPPAASKAASDRSSPNASSFIKSVSDSLIVLSLPLDGTTPPCQRRAGLLASGVRQSTETLLCCRADGEPHRPLSLTYEFARFIRRLKDLPQVRFHDLRHSFTRPNCSQAACIRRSLRSDLGMLRLGLRWIFIRMLPPQCRVKLQRNLTRRCRLRKVVWRAKNRSCGSKFGSIHRFGTRLHYPLLLNINKLRPRGGVVTQRSAKPFTPVQFRAWPPRKSKT